MKVFQTNKLYFGKWAYRVETSAPGASLIKRWGADEVFKFCTNAADGRYTRTYNRVDKQRLLKYLEKVKPFLDCDVKLRAEWDTLSFYINDPALYQELQTELRTWVISITEPANPDDLTFLQDNSAIILRTELPYGKYQHRVYIKNTMPIHTRTNFLTWINNYPDTIKASKGTVKWLEQGSPYFQDPFVYVTEQSQLLMLGLFLGGYLRSIQKFVLRDTGK